MRRPLELAALALGLPAATGWGIEVAVSINGRVEYAKAQPSLSSMESATTFCRHHEVRRETTTSKTKLHLHLTLELHIHPLYEL